MGYSGIIGTKSNGSALAWGGALRSIRLNEIQQSIGGFSATAGNPNSCLRLDTFGSYSFPMVVTPTLHTFSIHVNQSGNYSPRPSVVVTQNSPLGLIPITGVAPNSSGWTTITGGFTPTGSGVVVFKLQNNYALQYKSAPCFWDNFQLTRA